MMVFLRPMTVLLVMTLVSISVLTACATSDPHLLSTDDIAKQVGVHYGDPHAKTTDVKSTQADSPPHDAMYIITLVGDFHKNNTIAHSLSFSALATRMYVWNIYAYNQAGQELWHDSDWTHTY